MPHHGRDPRYGPPEPAPSRKSDGKRPPLELGPPLPMDYLRELWARYRHNNEVRPLIKEILRLHRTLRIAMDLQEDAYQALGKEGRRTDEAALSVAIALLRLALRGEPGVVGREPGAAKIEWVKQFHPPQD